MVRRLHSIDAYFAERIVSTRGNKRAYAGADSCKGKMYTGSCTEVPSMKAFVISLFHKPPLSTSEREDAGFASRHAALPNLDTFA